MSNTFLNHSLNQDISDLKILGLTEDSRRVEPGFLFAALPGATADGRAFIAAAVSRGAVAILAPTGTVVDPVVLGRARLITSDDPRHVFALLAARFHAPQPETVVAVTGTNGKTSVCSFARQLWTQLGHAGASIGTLGVMAPDQVLPGGLTTPDPVKLHATMADLARRGIAHLAMEASSHGLDQRRLDGVRIAAAAFTNLTRDHLDYHTDMDHYLAAKRRLFAELLPAGATAVLNADDPMFAELKDACDIADLSVIAYGATGMEIRLMDSSSTATGQVLVIRVLGREHSLHLPLAGRFQAMNALCALGLVLATGGEPQASVEAIRHLEGVPGRLQRVATRAGGAPVYVDYAHTPDALETVRTALRPHPRRHLSLVFGCGGDRDRGKRPQMGAIAHRLADLAIVTDDNPRSEDPAAIRREILSACPGAREIADRATAIQEAISELGSDDVLVIAGKGHERGQIVGSIVYPFDDAEASRDAIAILEHGAKLERGSSS
ncbi:MAG: UDP-N-acetylmuramoyl-L-alanyl-D-glutamate--2,6-diaminopimelate ligase [Alphaproteobacteria bacterium]|nr:UDP-N-acetylmuramoyl-L-alanyl-D-glutamate--2,6-diaminopimelate ligase [Alphaproteobacteria bacterium]